VPKLPDTPGLEAAGVIEAVGDGVIGLQVGMRVAAFAGKTYAEYCLAPVTQVVSLPDGVSFTDGAAFLIQGLTAYHLLHTADATGPGRTVLVHSAAGGVGILAVQVARAAGARVLAPVSSDAKAALVKESGAAAVINYAREKFADEGRRLTDNRGVDLIFDAVGKPTLEQSIRCLAPFGHVILYGRAPAERPIPSASSPSSPSHSRSARSRCRRYPDAPGQVSRERRPLLSAQARRPAPAPPAGPFRCPRPPVRTTTSNRDSRAGS
jgi:NADPH2:quinone reductase